MPSGGRPIVVNQQSAQRHRRLPQNVVPGQGRLFSIYKIKVFCSFWNKSHEHTMMVDNLISVVIPSFNHRKFISQAIRSVLNQTYQNIECIVIDDGSRDQSYEFVAETFKNDPRVRIFRQDNQGAASTLNKAISLSRGKFISILNSDDFYEAERLQIFMEAAISAVCPSFCISGVRIVDSHGAEVDRAHGHQEYYEIVRGFAENQPDIMGFWCGNIALSTSNFFFSKDVYAGVGPFKSLRYSHDWDWALRASAKFDVRRIDDLLINYRMHEANTINEPDPWGHIAEDAYVWASMLRGDRIRGRADDRETDTGLYFRNILNNIGFYMIPVLYLLADQRSDAQLLDSIAAGRLKGEIETLFAMERIDPVFIASLPRTMRALAAVRGENERLTTANAELLSIKHSTF
jgi:glycosyltransferase involved in cell wall biosynthesis